MGMIDVSEKPIVERRAEAEGTILLAADTVSTIRRGAVRKGDPLLVAEVAGMTAAKQTQLLIPHCHQIPLDTVQLTCEVLDDRVTIRCFVKASAKTGVEMEAIVGVSAALFTLWDMVKYLEKDAAGQYPATRITDIHVVRKEKGA